MPRGHATTRWARATCLALVVAGSVLLGAGSPATADPGAQRCGPAGGPSDGLVVTGWVDHDTTYDRAALDALPQRTVADTYLSGSGTTSANYTGVDLARLLELPTDSSGIGTLLRPSAPAGPQTPTQRNDLTRYSVMVTGSDCFQALFAMTEISPFFGGRPVLVATAQGPYAPGDLSPVTGSLGSAGFARTINPVDVRGSRRVSNIVEVRVLQAPAETATPPTQAPTCGGGNSSSLTVSGAVATPRTWDAADLAALPQTTVADTYLSGSGSTSANYTGVELWRLLGLSPDSGAVGSTILPNDPGPQAPAAQRNDLTRYSVVVTGSDCFQALFSLAEISPYFGGRPVLVATAQGAHDPDDLTPVTGSLGTAGFARISNPVDQRGSRRVSNIVDIRVLRSPTPLLTWSTPAPVVAGTPLGAAQLSATAAFQGSPVPGTVTYDPPAGTVLTPGTHTLTGLFVPAGPSSLTLARATTTLTVLPADAASPTPPAPVATAQRASRTSLRSSGRTQVAGSGERITLRATVSPGVTGGAVAFRDRGRLVKVEAVGPRGRARIRLPASTRVGVHRIRAVYVGDATTARSTSRTIRITVRRR